MELIWCLDLRGVPQFRAGESHMDLRGLLHWWARRILRTTPELWRESDAKVQEGFPAVAGPARGQRETRSVGSAVHCSGGSAVWGGLLLGHGRLRTIQGRAVAAFSAPGAWDPQSR